MYAKFCSKNLKEKDHLEVLSADGSVILEWIVEKMVKISKDWIHLVLDRHQETRLTEVTTGF
jgi:hypothetical protein